MWERGILREYKEACEEEQSEEECDEKEEQRKAECKGKGKMPRKNALKKKMFL